MPSPFPGMDPYLESPLYWRDFQQSFIYCCRAALAAQLPTGFSARLEERIVLVATREVFYPDFAVTRRPVNSSPIPGNMITEESDLSIALLPEADVDKPRVIRVSTEPIREPFIEIVARQGKERLVTTIELLSPTNKALSGEANAEYLKKQQALLKSGTHLLEIDLLRKGRHTVAVPEEVVAAEFGSWDYITCLHRAENGDEYEVLTRTVRQRLPNLPIPLTEDVPDVRIDLQAAFDRAYDDAGYVSTIDYTADPEPPLSFLESAWADTLLREKGLRP